MMKKIAQGLIWFVVGFVVLCVIIYFVSAAIQNPSETGANGRSLIQAVGDAIGAIIAFFVALAGG